MGHYWNLPVALIIILGTCGLTYRLSHYLITLAGAGFILFIGQARLIPSAMPEQLVGLLVSVALAIGIAYNHAYSQWMAWMLSSITTARLAMMTARSRVSKSFPAGV